MVFLPYLFRVCMQWNEERDILLVCEMAASGICQTKSDSRERGNSWQIDICNDFILTLTTAADPFPDMMGKYKS